ncbi:PilZ domain-containing protein [Thalassotalea euphylliae]|uniref:PilZ domain-containing protein n=1 Tax=Thalassotalea euphylliae TaxID=1655234 RepID=A0A3E0UF85_9GAMM|nr:PilZ domain-containing protein [Thalassotalea euphylliae]REL29523.1 PilZ domain-containing protein [Thalassotalea euphylliae]REL35549.1 PilZ domain-containing protein [Thalassotalea euphylliae]
MVNFDDKRNFYRMLLNSEVKVTIIDDEINSEFVATCRDLSATGMAIEMSHPLEMGTRVKAKIESANASVQALDVKGKVVRIEEEATDLYLVGIAIDDMD